MTVRTLALTLVAALSLAACSGEGDAPIEPGSPTVAGTPAEVATTTAPGTTLALGESGTVAWRVDPATVGTVDLVVAKVQRRSPAVLAGWVPQDQVTDTTPYFVRATVTNAGATDLGSVALPLYLRGSGGVLSPAVTFEGDFTRCPSTPLPDPFAAGDVEDVCLVYTLAPGIEPDAMVFQPTSTELGVAWSVE